MPCLGYMLYQSHMSKDGTESEMLVDLCHPHTLSIAVHIANIIITTIHVCKQPQVITPQTFQW